MEKSGVSTGESDGVHGVHRRLGVGGRGDDTAGRDGRREQEKGRRLTVDSAAGGIAFRVEPCGAGRCVVMREEHGRTSRMEFDMPASAMAERLGRKDGAGRMPHVQRLFPEFDADQREFFISGMLPGELDFGGDE